MVVYVNLLVQRPVLLALSVVTALRHRDATGQGQRISIPLENVALATAGNLSFLTEVMVNGASRQRIGNSIYGQYGQEFTSGDGASFMVVALTNRHFRDLTELTGTAEAVAALANTLDADFTDEGERYRHRDALDRAFRRLVRRAHGLRGDRGAVGIVCAVGALPHLRRSGRRRTGDGQPDVHPHATSLESASTWRRVYPSRSTATTRRRSPHPPSATTPAVYSPSGWGSASRISTG